MSRSFLEREAEERASSKGMVLGREASRCCSRGKEESGGGIGG